MSKAIFRFCAIAALVLGSVAALSAQRRVVGKYGAARVQGRDVVVQVWVVVPPGLDGNEVALKALRGQGARPFQSEEFTTTGPVWDEFFDGNPLNDFVTEYYNSPKRPHLGRSWSAGLPEQTGHVDECANLELCFRLRRPDQPLPFAGQGMPQATEVWTVTMTWAGCP